MPSSSGTIEPINPDGTPWHPAFPGQRPPFQPGNDLGIRHGAYSPRTVEPVARSYIADIEADPATAYLAQPRFATALHSWATACARVDLVQAYIDEIGIEAAMTGSPGSPAPMELLDRFSGGRDRIAARLGLDPLSAARLGKDIAQGRQATAATMLTELRAQHDADTHTD